MNAVIMSVQGIAGGSIDLLSDRIVIKRKGLNALILQGVKGDKEILITQISAIQFKRPSAWTSGYIQFSFLGGQESKAGIFAATQDENTVMFRRDSEQDFVALKDKITEMMVALRTGSKSSSNLDELSKLGELKTKGIITEEEFQIKKKQLLGL